MADPTNPARRATFPGGDPDPARREPMSGSAEVPHRFEPRTEQPSRDIQSDATETGHDFKARAREKKEDLVHRAEREAESQKSVLAERTHALARALRDAGNTLRRDGESDIARFSDGVADRFERMSRYLERNDVHGMLHDFEDTARTHPAAFTGGTFAAGLALGRFLRSSSPEPRHHDGNGTVRSFAAAQPPARREPASPPATTSPARPPAFRTQGTDARPGQIGRHHRSDERSWKEGRNG